MRYSNKRRLYSQNFLRSPELVDKLIRKSSICHNDIVVEIGPGKGIITDSLIKQSKKVIAIEKDQRLFDITNQRFSTDTKLQLFKADILQFQIPKESYKVFSNIPFSITADIMRKLTEDEYFSQGFIIMQKEAARKFLGMPFAFKNTATSVYLKAYFEINVFWEFKRNDFIPRPGVDVVMIDIKRRLNPDVEGSDKKLFRCFVEVLFNENKVSKIPYNKIYYKFKKFKDGASRVEIESLYKKAKALEMASKNIKKIRRTRVRNKWRAFIKRDSH